MSLDKETIHVDYSRLDLPESARNFQPTMFKDGETFCCVLGADEQAICGEGNSVEAALVSWDKHYQEKKKQRAGL